MTDWIDGPCHYVTVVDGPRVGWLLGPLREPPTVRLINEVEWHAGRVNAFATFYSFGGALRPDGHLAGTFNAEFGVKAPGDIPVAPKAKAKAGPKLTQSAMDFDDEDDTPEPDWAGMVARGQID